MCPDLSDVQRIVLLSIPDNIAHGDSHVGRPDEAVNNNAQYLKENDLQYREMYYVARS